MDYLQRKEHYINKLLSSSFTITKTTFLFSIKYCNNFNSDVFNSLHSLVQQHKGKSDFNLVILIRFLYLNNPLIEESQNQLIETLQNFPFWISKDERNKEEDRKYSSMRKVCFWSENHILMYLSASHLFYEKIKDKNLNSLIKEKELQLLLAYLRAHVTFHGVYEVLSHVYLPYTLSALLNLYDFSTNQEIHTLSEQLINIIIEQLLLCTNINGIGTYTPSTRQFNKTQTRSWGHNMNQLIYFLTGKIQGDVKPTAITDILLTSNWTPNSEYLQFFNMTGFYRQTQSHKTNDTRKIYLESDHFGLDPIEFTPFYWLDISFILFLYLFTFFFIVI